MTTTFMVQLTLQETQCYSCATWFGMDADFYKNRLADHKDFYCPNGHAQRFVSETDAEKYKRLLNAERDHAASLRAQRDQAQASARAHKGQATRLRNRAVAGVCAFCNRHFTNVEKHVANKHPEQPTDE